MDKLDYFLLPLSYFHNSRLEDSAAFVHRGLMFARILVALALAAGSQFSTAQSYPTKPVRIVVPFTSGGTNDIVARLLGQKLGEALSQQFVVENRAGASGTIGVEAVARSSPDGYTLLLGSASSVALNVSLYTKLPYNTEKDLAPIMQVGTGPFVLAVHPNLPVRNVKQLIALAKARPGQLNFGSAGSGTAMHLTAELFKSLAGVNMLHVPYKGASAAIPDLLAGNLQVMFSDMPAFAPYVKAGRLRAVGVTSATRSAVLPELPTIAESGVPGYEATSWYGVLGPAGMPNDVIAKLNNELKKIVRMPEIRERFTALGMETIEGTPEQFRTYVHAEIRRWGEVVKSSGTKLE